MDLMFCLFNTGLFYFVYLSLPRLVSPSACFGLVCLGLA